MNVCVDVVFTDAGKQVELIYRGSFGLGKQILEDRHLPDFVSRDVLPGLFR